MNGRPSDLSLFVGHFHPVLVHLPIGLIVLVFILELLGRWPRFQQARAANGVILFLAAPASAVSALCGWLLSRGGGYDPQLLNWHLWTGLGVAAACLLALLLRRLEARPAYHLVLAGAAVLLIVASHFGGSLTHGRDYLTRYAPAPLRDWVGGKTKSEPPNRAAGAKPQSAFLAVVSPILERHCVECHGPEKSKADLRFDTLEALCKGGENGPVFGAGQSSASLMIKRLLLPPDDENHMPPQGKLQPSADEIALLKWWIDAGAPGDKTIAELRPPADIQRLLAAQSAVRATAVPAPQPPDTAPKPAAEILPLAGQIAAELGLAVTPLSQTDAWLQCSASLARTNFGDAELARLAPLALNVRWLDLGGTGVSDTGLVQVAAMKHLTKLHLERTSVTDAGLAQLAGLGELEYLNLYGTTITEAGLVQLKSFPKLRQLYLWQTKVSSNAAKSFADQSVDQEQIKRWEEEIAALRAKIKSQGIFVDAGIPLLAAKPAKPINDKCPITGKDIVPNLTSSYEGKLVAFCCEKCKAAFDQDPKPSLAKLGLTASTQKQKQENKP